MERKVGSGSGEPRIGVYICHCGANIAQRVDVPEVVEFAGTLPKVIVAREYKFMCSDPGQELIKQDIRDLGINRVVVASCSPLMHELTFRRALEEAGENPFHFQMANIREQVSWVSLDGEMATAKAKALVAAAVRRVALHQPLERKRVPVHPDLLVLGGGIAGIHAALTLAESGKRVYLVEREPSIGGQMAKFDKTFPTLDCAACILTPKMTAVRAHPNIELLSYSEVEAVDGFVGNFRVKIRKKARYVDEEKCTACGECEKVCPVEHPSEFDEGLGRRKAIFRPFPQAVPNVFLISRLGTPPCQAACPIHQNAQGYITLVREGKFKEALEVILRDNPLPSVCGRICTHPCTDACTRGEVDEPLHISGIKRFVLDFAGEYELPRPEPGLERAERVAIVGSGPAGLMCAYELRQRGYKPTIFEALPQAGGMLAMGVPSFRLPREVLKREIGKIEALGVEIRLSTPIGQELKLEDLRKEYQAVFIAIGAHVERRLGVPGEALPGVFGGVELLRRVSLGGEVELGRRVLVIGGGNSAVDAARTALRLGAEEVRIVYRRTRAEMPASPEEVEEAEREGVKLEFLAAPKRILGNGQVTSLECLRMELGEPDEAGRRRPVPLPGSEFTVPCDSIIITIGQAPDLASLGEARLRGLGLETTSQGTLTVDPVTLQTSLPGVFAGGDCVTGPDVVVTAMAAGKKAAISIDRYLKGLDMSEGRKPELEGPFKSEVKADTEGVPLRPRVPMPSIDLSHRRGFEEVKTGYTEGQAKEEASRCLDCAICCDCRLCATVCEPQAIDYQMKEQEIEVEVGAIILATGFKSFDPRRISYLGYGRYPNVLTALEFERMINSAGPTGGKLLLQDGREPKSVGIIHCVGSRDKRFHPYCSRVCCMYSLKFAHLVKERTDAEVYNFYIDLRAFGKGYEEFYNRVLAEGAHLIRGNVGEVTDVALTPEEEGKLILSVEDTLAGFVRRIPVDMVVLATGLEPQPDAEEIRRMFNISCSREGWFLERHPKLAPVSTFTDGIFLAGACQGPKDIPDAVAQAGAAAAEALALIDRGFVELEPNTAYIDEALCSGCKTCITLCPFSAISFDRERGVAVVNEALCKGCGTCVAACPSGAAQQSLFTDEQIYTEIEGVLVDA